MVPIERMPTSRRWPLTNMGSVALLMTGSVMVGLAYLGY